MVEDLQRRLQEARVTETALPADIDRLQAELQREFSRVQSREAGKHAPRHVPGPFQAAVHACVAGAAAEFSRMQSREAGSFRLPSGLAVDATVHVSALSAAS